MSTDVIDRAVLATRQTALRLRRAVVHHRRCAEMAKEADMACIAARVDHQEAKGALLAAGGAIDDFGVEHDAPADRPQVMAMAGQSTGSPGHAPERTLAGLECDALALCTNPEYQQPQMMGVSRDELWRINEGRAFAVGDGQMWHGVTLSVGHARIDAGRPRGEATNC